MSHTKRILIALIVSCVSSIASADAMRCKGKLIKVDDTTAKLLQLCGEPSSRDGWMWIYENTSTGKVTLRVVSGRVKDIQKGNLF
jgi:hypothetical protein